MKTSVPNAKRAKIIGLRLTPLDSLIFRDGKPFESGARADSLLPMPQTLAGALRTHLLEGVGCDWGSLRTQLQQGKTFRQAMEALAGCPWIGNVLFRGPWLASPKGGTLDLFLPTPAVLYQEKAEKKHVLHRLGPLAPQIPLPGWRPKAEALRPLWLSHPVPLTKVEQPYLTSTGWKAFIEGKVPAQNDLLPSSELYEIDRRVNIAMDSELNATVEGDLFSLGYLVLKEHIHFYAEVVIPAEAPAALFSQETLLPFGGEGRKVVMSPLPAPFAWPRSAHLQGPHPMLILTTPAIFSSGKGYPSCLEGKMIAAAVPQPIAVSGWNLAKGGPKPTRFAAPAGSTFFLDDELTSLPAALSDDEEDQLQGWGCFIQGVWHD
jgi:CRISPR-associated protein Cmr3